MLGSSRSSGHWPVDGGPHGYYMTWANDRRPVTSRSLCNPLDSQAPTRFLSTVGPLRTGMPYLPGVLPETPASRPPTQGYRPRSISRSPVEAINLGLPSILVVDRPPWPFNVVLVPGGTKVFGGFLSVVVDTTGFETFEVRLADQIEDPGMGMPR
jgi:hypothetical protein